MPCQPQEELYRNHLTSITEHALVTGQMWTVIEVLGFTFGNKARKDTEQDLHARPCHMMLQHMQQGVATC